LWWTRASGAVEWNGETFATRSLSGRAVKVL